MPPKKKRTSLKTNIQVRNNFSEEVVNYQKQVKLLQKEIETYKEKIIILQNENDILKSHINNGVKIRLSNETSHIGLMGTNSLKISNENLSSSVLGAKIAKGCSCKGNCANKICGCVKKGISCQIFCKCNELHCKNQESNKENIEQIELSADGQKVLEKLGHLSLNQESLHASEKKSKRGIFSPFMHYNNITNNDELHSASPVTLETRRRLFTQDSDELVDINDSLDEKNVPHLNIEENCNDIDNSQNEIQNHLTVTKINKSILDSPKLSRKKSKSLSPIAHVYQRKYEKDNNKIIISKIKSISSNENLNYLKNIEESQSTYNEIEHHHPKLSNADNAMSDNTINNKTDESEIQIKVSPPSKMKNSASPKTIANGTSSSTDNKDISDISLNPMMPKRQLRRSPVTVAGTAIILAENKRFSPPKKELAVAEVNWIQHKSELVMCTICKRKFFPHRIEKHKISCKGI